MRNLALVLLVTACSSGGGGGVDATPVVDIDNASCGDLLNFTGELVDADSTSATFCGVNNAMLDGAAMDNTSPNGRFAMCIPAMGTSNLTLTPPGTASSCSNMPGTYTLPAIVVANPATIRAGAFWSGRLITMQRMATLVPSFDAAKAHVMVHVEGQKRAVAILATHGAAQSFNGTSWGAGEMGNDVLFPNVDVANGSTMLTVVGGAIGTGSIPLQAGKLTLVTVLAQ